LAQVYLIQDMAAEELTYCLLLAHQRAEEEACYSRMTARNVRRNW